MGFLEDAYKIAKDVSPKVWKWATGQTQSKYQKRLELAKSALENECLIPYLTWKYRSYKLFERGGQLYPIIVFPVAKPQVNRPNSILGELTLKSLQSSDFVSSDSEYRSIVSKMNLFSRPESIDNPSYVLERISQTGKLLIESRLGSYFGSYDTCESLEWELRSEAHNLKELSQTAFQKFDRRLPHRNKLHQIVADPVIDGKGRCAAIGISTLIAYKEGSRYNLITRLRAKNGVPLRAGLRHVIPSFMFRPRTNMMEREYDVTHNVFREYLGEVFSLSLGYEDTAYNSFYTDPRLQYLRKLISSRKAHLFVTGIVVNLLNLRPDICTLLLIHDKKWFEKSSKEPSYKWKINEEFARHDDLHSLGLKAEDFINSVPLSEDSSMINSLSLYPNKTVPPCAGAFWLGVDLIRKVTK